MECFVNVIFGAEINFFSLKSELCDARSKLESQAYAAWIRGSFFFEVKAWKEAMDNLQQAQ